MKKRWMKTAVILTMGISCTACGGQASWAQEEGSSAEMTWNAETDSSEGAENVTLIVGEMSETSGNQNPAETDFVSPGNNTGGENVENQVKIVYPTDLNHNGVQETLTVKFSKENSSVFRLEIIENGEFIWTSGIYSYSPGAYSLCTEGGQDYLIYYYAGELSGYSEYRFERFCLNEDNFPETVERRNLTFSADYAGYPLDADEMVSFAEHVNEHFGKSVLLCSNLENRIRYSNGQTLYYEEKFQGVLPEADWTGYTTLREMLDYKNEYLYHMYKEEIDALGSICELEADNDYSTYLLAHGQEFVETDFLTLGPVENIVYVPDAGMIHIYHSGVYCGYITSANYGEDAWSGEVRESVLRVFGGAREAIELKEWNLAAINPYLQAVCSYEADNYDAGSAAAMMANGVFAFENEAAGRDLEGWGACFGMKNTKSGYVLWAAEEMVDEELLKELLGAIAMSDKSFTSEAFAALKAQEKIECRPQTYTGRELAEMSEKGLVSFEITAGDMKYEVPKELAAICEDDGQWGLYTYFRSGLVKVGEVQVRDAAGEKNGTVTEEKLLFTAEQQKWLKAQPDQAGMADDTYTLTTTVFVSADGSRVMEIWQLEFEVCEDEE